LEIIKILDMVKTQIQEKVYEELGVRRDDIKLVTNCFIKHLAEALKTEPRVKIDGIGVFSCVNRPERSRAGFGKVFTVGESRSIRFTPAKPLTRLP